METLVLSERDMKLLLEALAREPAPNKALIEAARRYQEAIKSGKLVSR